MMRDISSSEVVVAYLGPQSSYTHQVELYRKHPIKQSNTEQAAVDSFDDPRYILRDEHSIRGNLFTGMQLFLLDSLYSDVFIAVQSCAASFGVVPFENSSNGAVLFTLDLLIDRGEDFPDVHVNGEAYIDVQHCLLGYVSKSTPFENKDILSSALSSGSATPTTKEPFPREPRAKPLTDLRQIKRIYSHPQAFGQCEAFLATYLKGVERIDVSSTSKAASIVAVNHDTSEAAISSRLAADINNLPVLAQGIQDAEDNTTRFLIIQRGPANVTNQDTLPDKFKATNGVGTKRKALIAFSVSHEAMGTLTDALLVFKTHGLNLTNFNPRPSRIRPWHYIFLVELASDRVLEDPNLLHAALKDLDILTEGNKWLGCWVDRLGR